MAVAVATFVFVITSLGVAFTNACVNYDPACRPQTSNLAPWVFNGGLTSSQVIANFSIAGLTSLLSVIALIWGTCWCCHRCNSMPKTDAPQKKKIARIDSFKSVAPVVDRRPTEIVVVDAPSTKPQALHLNISDPSHSSPLGPTVSARLARPLTFTITPDYGMR